MMHRKGKHSTSNNLCRIHRIYKRFFTTVTRPSPASVEITSA